jgi:hypothetical protein
LGSSTLEDRLRDGSSIWGLQAWLPTRSLPVPPTIPFPDCSTAQAPLSTGTPPQHLEPESSRQSAAGSWVQSVLGCLCLATLETTIYRRRAGIGWLEPQENTQPARPPREQRAQQAGRSTQVLAGSAQLRLQLQANKEIVPGGCEVGRRNSYTRPLPRLAGSHPQGTALATQVVQTQGSCVCPREVRS